MQETTPEQEQKTPQVGADGSNDVSAAQGQKSKHTLLVASAVAAAVLVVGVAGWLITRGGSTTDEPKVLKIGFMAPGGTATNGAVAMRRGIELAKKDITIPNVTIQIVEKVTDCEADTAAKTMRQFVSEGAVAVIGEYCSGATLGAAPVANQSHVPIISSASTSADITKAGDYVFRTIPSDALTGPFTANAMKKQGYERLAIMYEEGDEYTEGLRDTMKASFEAVGGTVVATEAHPARASDVTAQMQRIKAANPDVLYIAGGTDTPVSILSKKKELGLVIPVYSAETLQDRAFIDDAGAVANGLNIVTVNVGGEEFTEKHKAAYDVDPDVYTAQSYDAYMALARAIKAGASTGEAVKNGLYGVDFTGASGHIKFDKNGDVTGDHVVYRLQDRKLTIVTL